MAQNEKENVTVTPNKPKALYDGVKIIDDYHATVSCTFDRRKFYDKDKRTTTHYVSAVCRIDDEEIRFKLNQKDSRLFQYFLKKMGLIERDTREIYVEEQDTFGDEEE